MNIKKTVSVYRVVISILLILAAACAAATGVLTYLGILFEFEKPIWILIVGCAIAAVAVILLIWFLCICSSLRKYAKE